MAEYAALGFDPAPGNPETVLALAKKLSASATSLGEASRVVKDLVSHSSAWQGEAATAFRASLSQDLPRYLGAAHTSLADAARRLTGWHDTLVSHRALATQYEARAGAAKTEETLADARRLARELASEHGAAARRVAQTLNAATDRLAPKEPGLLASIWNKIVEDPADAMSNASAILGAIGAGVALLFPPAGLAIMLVGSGLSLAALAMHTSDPKFRKSLTDGFTKGQFDADFWKSSVTLLGDTAGAVPGVAAVASGAKAGTAAARAAMAAAPEGSALTGMGAGATSFRTSAWSTGVAMQEVESPLATWALRNTTNPTVRNSVNMVGPSAGFTTAVLDYGPDNETIDHASTAADGGRLAVDDAPSALAKSKVAWSVIRP
ncbi:MULTISPECIES: hypothetical protein [unclassified Streptomyces]|uniref:hypothetical protein n=1 Tax=unclassified Streptomyces TaxID=2593676 RepID=UPI000AF6B870|nr:MULTISPECIES: hypothetical protein [unclassified Streptomyces]